MKATIITIGDEILIGQIEILIRLYKSLDKIGVEINEMISISE
jgi:molybdopterin-biosynthesis enzyme MoeA-like protein